MILERNENNRRKAKEIIYIESRRVVYQVLWSRNFSSIGSYIEFETVVHGFWQSRKRLNWLLSGTDTYRDVRDVNFPIWVGIAPESLLLLITLSSPARIPMVVDERYNCINKPRSKTRYERYSNASSAIAQRQNWSLSHWVRWGRTPSSTDSKELK